MARPLRITYPGAFYHITSRGNERKAIFKCSGTPLKAIGERYGLGESGVSQVGRRLDTRKAEDAALRLVMAKIDRAINKSSGST